MNQTEELTAREIAMRAITGTYQVEGNGYFARIELENHITELIEQHTQSRLSAFFTKIKELDYITYDRPDLSTGIAYDEDDLKSLLEEELER